jgi:hypothetical protein
MRETRVSRIGECLTVSCQQNHTLIASRQRIWSDRCLWIDQSIQRHRSEPHRQPHSSGKIMQIGPGSGSDATLAAPAEPDINDPDSNTQRIVLFSKFIATLLRQPRNGACPS